jgi:hypothetical protein
MENARVPELLGSSTHWEALRSVAERLKSKDKK